MNTKCSIDRHSNASKQIISMEEMVIWMLFVADSHRFCDKVQDPYTLRCLPQVIKHSFLTIMFFSSLLLIVSRSSNSSIIRSNSTVSSSSNGIIIVFIALWIIVDVLSKFL